MVQLAETASELVGRTVVCEVVDQEDRVASWVAARQPEAVARLTLGMYQAAEQGFFAGVEPLLADLLGREPRTARDARAATPGR